MKIVDGKDGSIDVTVSSASPAVADLLVKRAPVEWQEAKRCEYSGFPSGQFCAEYLTGPWKGIHVLLQLQDEGVFWVGIGTGKRTDRDELLAALKELLEVAVPMSETAGRDCVDSSMSKARALIARIEGGK